MTVCTVESAAYSENLAYNKAATQSSNLHENKWLAGAAVDGNGNQILTGNSCACTAYYKPTVWWKVDLGNVYALSNVKIFYRNEGTVFRLTGFKLYVTLEDNFISSSPVYVNNNGVQDRPYPPANITVTVSTYGQYVTLYKERSVSCAGSISTNVCALLELCEVEVLGCPEKKYGTDCQSYCPDNCFYDVCTVSDGKCYQCKAGYTGELCDTPCVAGTYGIDCSQQCSGNCKGGTNCNVTTGICPSGCSDGYQGMYCNKTCSQGSYGSSCLSSCRSCRNDVTCNHVNGSCPTGCGLGVTGQYCRSPCRNGQYGYNCNVTCSGYSQNNLTCNVQTGYCDNGCAAGWKGDKCNTVCSSGEYGLNCLNNCTGNCENETSCSPIDGTCQYGCKSGWKGNVCNQVCVNGRYGHGCSQYCGHCNNSMTCDRDTVICPRGCADGYKDILCKEKCDVGMYGRNCSFVCSSCNTTCDHVTGECGNTDLFVQNPQQSNATTAIAAGVGATVVVIIIVIVVVVLVLRMRRKSKDAERRFSKRISTYLTEDNDNQPGPSAVYAEVDKSNKTPISKKNIAHGPSALYADVDKSNKISRPQKNIAPGPSALYAKVDKSKGTPRPKKNVTPGPSDLYAEVDKSSKSPKSGIHGVDGVQSGPLYEDVDTKSDKNKNKKPTQQNGPDRNVNPQGLVYVDVEFPNATQNKARPIDSEERTEYASLQMQ